VPITRYLSDRQLTLEQRHILELSFNTALRQLHLVDRNDPVCEIIAKRVVDIHRRGVRDAVAISEIAVREFGLPEGG
jgi:hypothetical protein